MWLIFLLQWNIFIYYIVVEKLTTYIKFEIKKKVGCILVINWSFKKLISSIYIII